MLHFLFTLHDKDRRQQKLWKKQSLVLTKLDRVKSSQNSMAVKQKYLKVNNSARIEIRMRAKVHETKLISIKIMLWINLMKNEKF